MARKPSTKTDSASSSTATIGFEAKLWLAADKLRNNMDAAEYKHVVLGLIFLKYISDTFEEHRAKLLAGEGDYAGANPEDPDEYKAENIFWVPADARWSLLQANAKQPSIGKTVDDAIVAIERDNPRLKGVLPKDYARPGLDKHRLGELIDLIATISLTAASEGEKTHSSVDLLGRVYEYFLTRFASAEGKNGGQFYTPSCVVRCLVEMLEPCKGRIYDPACGSGGMLVQSEKFVESHGGKLGDISIYGQESNATTRRLVIINLAIRGIEADIGKEHADTFRNVQHPNLRADYVLANPPFNDSDWFRKDDDVRWQFGVPPKGNANFAWVQHFIHHRAPQGMAGFVLANGSMSSNQSGEGDIRRALIEADLVDCVVALPAALDPEHLEDSPLGHIPKGWKAGTVVEGFNLTMGQSPPGDTYNEEDNGLPFYQGRTDFGFRFPTYRMYCTKPTRCAKPGDTLVSVRAPVGGINMANEECCIGRGVAAVRHKSGAPSFTYHSMANLYPDFARFEAEGTVFGSINKDSFEKLRFVIPPDDIVAAYERQAGPLD